MYCTAEMFTFRIYHEQVIFCFSRNYTFFLFQNLARHTVVFERNRKGIQAPPIEMVSIIYLKAISTLLYLM